MQAKKQKLTQTLWQLYHRTTRPIPWGYGGNLPWDDPDFSQRMLREHLDESHGAASRVATERQLQLAWLWQKCQLHTGANVLDVTCGPGFYTVGLAQWGCMVTAVDFAPAAIAYARQLAAKEEVSGRCTFIQQDVRQIRLPSAYFDAAILLYGQLAVFTKAEAQALLTTIADSLTVGGILCVELLDQRRVDKEDSSWWFTDDTGLWGDAPFLHLGERFWHEEEKTAIERYHILHLETGEMTEIQLCDQTYATSEMVAMMRQAGFATVEAFAGWDGLALYDAVEWVVYVAKKG